MAEKAKKNGLLQELTKGIIAENPVFRLVLGTCPTLAVTTAASNAIGMGVAATLVLVCSNAVISMLRHVIPDKVRMVGTCRNLDSRLRDEIPGRMEAIIKGVTEGMGGSYRFEYLRCYSPTVNDDGMFRLVADAIAETQGADALDIPESANLTGEDFSFFGEQVPSCYFWLGCRAPGAEFYPLHHGSFCADENSFAIGMEVMVAAALKFLSNEGSES